MSKAIRSWLLVVFLAFSAGALAHKVDDPAKYVTTRLSVTGLVENRLDLSVDDLKTLPQQQFAEVPIVNHEGKANTTLRKVRGVLLRDILTKAVIKSTDHGDIKRMAIIATASDGYVALYSSGEVLNSPLGDGILVFYENAGKQLADADGRIAMVSVRDNKTGFRHVRWLKNIEVRKLVD